MNTERHKKLREHRLALGKCGDCLNEALPGKNCAKGFFGECPHNSQENVHE